MKTEIEKFWRLAVAQNPDLVGLPMPEAWTFGDSPEMADELAALVVSGIKTGTSSSLQEYEVEGEPLPEQGQLDIVLDGCDNPVALIKTTEVEVLRFSEVTAQHAWWEGEGDRSLGYWRDVHQDFWSRITEFFNEDMFIVYERFELIFADIPQFRR